MSKERNVVRFFIDTEFIEDGKTIDLISIAVVPAEPPIEREIALPIERWREPFYRCNTEANLSLASEWVQQNVLPHLPNIAAEYWGTRFSIAQDLLEYVNDRLPQNWKPEFWGYFADYDWVALCQLYGKMIDLPKGLPMYCMDLKQLMVLKGVKKEELPPQSKNSHDALEDALWNRKAFNYLITKPYVYL